MSMSPCFGEINFIYPGPEMPENIAAFWPETIEDAKGDGFDGGDTTCAQRAQSSFGWMKIFHKWTWFFQSLSEIVMCFINIVLWRLVERES